MKPYFLAPLALLLACPSDPAEVDTDGSSGTGSSTDDPTMTSVTSVTMSSTTMTSMSATGTTDDTTTASTTDTTTVSTTDTDGTTTDPDTSGETTEPTTTDPSSESGGSSSTTTGGDPAYGPCDFSVDPLVGECPKGEQCSILPTGEHWCAIACNMDATDCPAIATGDAIVECSNFYMACALNCTDGEDCPDGMDCVPIAGVNISRCGWPGA